MFKIPTLFIAFGLMVQLFTAGCATTNRPIYTPPTGTGTARINGGSANVIKFFTQGAAHVSIIEIDGLYLPPSLWTGDVRSVAVTPGLRKVTILLRGNGYTEGQDTIQFETIAGHTYQIHAQKVGIAFDVSVVDDSNAVEHKVVFSGRINGGSSGGPAYVPIFIPVK
jgi:hypothetical protein